MLWIRQRQATTSMKIEKNRLMMAGCDVCSVSNRSSGNSEEWIRVKRKGEAHESSGNTGENIMATDLPALFHRLYSFVELGPWLTVLDKGSQRSQSLVFCVTVAMRDLEIRIVGIEQRNDLTLQYGRILQEFVHADICKCRTVADAHDCMPMTRCPEKSILFTLVWCFGLPTQVHGEKTLRVKFGIQVS